MRHTTIIIAAALAASGCHTSRHADAVASDSTSTHLNASSQFNRLRADSMEYVTSITADSIVWQWRDSLHNYRKVAYGVSSGGSLRRGSTQALTISVSTDSTATAVSQVESHTESTSDTGCGHRWIWCAGIMLLIAAVGALLCRR